MFADSKGSGGIMEALWRRFPTLQPVAIGVSFLHVQISIDVLV